MNITPETIALMSDEEVRELNRTLGKKVLKRWALLHGAKWAAVFGTIYVANKYMGKDETN